MSVAPLRLVFNPTGALLDAAIDCEAEVFLTWYGNTSQQLFEEYSPYADDSLFMAVVDRYGTALGAARLIVPVHGHVKTLDDVEGPPWNVDRQRVADAADLDTDRTWDLATLGVRHGRTGTNLMVAAALYHGLFLAYRANGFRSIVAVIDQKVRALTDAIGMVLHTLPGTFPTTYLGSPESTPVYGHCADLLDVQRRLSPDGYRLIAQGIGLDGISIPPVDSFRLPVDRVGRVISLPTTADLPAAAGWS